LWINMYLNDVDINKRSMNKICLGILWILVGMYVSQYVVFCGALMQMLGMNVK